MNYDNPRLIIDRKQNLTEVCSNVCQQHERFRREIIRAQEMGIKLIFLVEHGKGIKSLEDVIWWSNPRKHKRIQDPNTHRWKTIETNAMEGETLYKILCTMQNKYGVEFLFCEKENTGKEIIRLLSGESYDNRRD